jgi:hypothetical protein
MLSKMTSAKNHKTPRMTMDEAKMAVGNLGTFDVSKNSLMMENPKRISMITWHKLNITKKNNGLTSLDNVNIFFKILKPSLKVWQSLRITTRGRLCFIFQSLIFYFRSRSNIVYVEDGIVTWPNAADLAPDAMYYAIKKDGQ